MRRPGCAKPFCAPARRLAMPGDLDGPGADDSMGLANETRPDPGTSPSVASTGVGRCAGCLSL